MVKVEVTAAASSFARSRSAPREVGSEHALVEVAEYGQSVILKQQIGRQLRRFAARQGHQHRGPGNDPPDRDGAPQCLDTPLLCGLARPYTETILWSFSTPLSAHCFRTVVHLPTKEPLSAERHPELAMRHGPLPIGAARTPQRSDTACVSRTWIGCDLLFGQIAW